MILIHVFLPVSPPPFLALHSVGKRLWKSLSQVFCRKGEEKPSVKPFLLVFIIRSLIYEAIRSEASGSGGGESEPFLALRGKKSWIFFGWGGKGAKGLQ